MSRLRFLLVCAPLLAIGCKVDENAFQQRVFACDTAAATPLCGTDQAGAPMTCFAARQLGGTDFCASSCEWEALTPADETTVCVQSNARLDRCKPSDGDGACGRPELGCLRTDVQIQNDEGVCVTMKPCSEDSDCKDPVRSTCASTFFKELYGKSHEKLQTDHLYCLQEGCERDGTACSPGETCLRQVLPANAHAPDICVPKCDSAKQCPPNFICLKAKEISGSGNPAVCVPGLLGFKCQSDTDCLVGRCLSDGGDQLIAGSKSLNICTVDCENDADCELFDSQQGIFFCNQEHHCVTPSAYFGASCDTQLDCERDPDTTFCIHISGPNEQGTCAHLCSGDGTCPALGGVPHTCLNRSATSPGLCLPGVFGFPCGSDDNCMPGLRCREAAPGKKICTALCELGKDDCELNRFTAGQGFCGGQFCLQFGSLPEGSRCTADEQCSNKLACKPSVAMSDGPSTCGGK